LYVLADGSAATKGENTIILTGDGADEAAGSPPDRYNPSIRYR
jgi:hypothetical protein